MRTGSPIAFLEMLEDRRLLSAVITPGFAGNLPASLPVAGVSHLTVRLTDTGTSRAVGLDTIQIFASTDPGLNAGSVLLDSKQLRIHLASRARESISLAFPTPTNLDGDYYLVASVASSGAVATSAKPVAIASPFSDLSLSFGHLPSDPIEMDGPSAGQRCATVLLTNSGNIPVDGRANVSLFLSTDANFDASDPLLATVKSRVMHLKPGRSAAVHIRIAVPAGTAVGGYFLIASLSPAGLVTDTNSTNNVVVSSRRVAVVTQLPPPHINDNQQVYYELGGGVALCDVGGVYIVESDTTIIQDDSSGDSIDDSAINPAPTPTDPGNSSNNSDSPDTPATDAVPATDPSPTPDPSPTTDPTPTTPPSQDDSGSSDNSSSDTWDSGDYSNSGGDW